MEQLEQLPLQGKASKTRLRQERFDEKKFILSYVGEKKLVDKVLNQLSSFAGILFSINKKSRN